MKTINLNIGLTPAILIGEKSDKVFLFVHGLHGQKEEAMAFAGVAVPEGYQVMGIDLPVDGKPWDVMPLISEVRDYLYQHWKYVSVRANSIGSWFTLLAFQGYSVEQALLVSPLLDMKKFIELMPQREDDYYNWVVRHPIADWNATTYILRPDKDLVVDESVGRELISTYQCHVTIMADGEHWFHTPAQMIYLKEWELYSLQEV